MEKIGFLDRGLHSKGLLLLQCFKMEMFFGILISARKDKTEDCGMHMLKDIKMILQGVNPKWMKNDGVSIRKAMMKLVTDMVKKNEKW